MAAFPRVEEMENQTHGSGQTWGAVLGSCAGITHPEPPPRGTLRSLVTPGAPLYCTEMPQTKNLPGKESPLPALEFQVFSLNRDFRLGGVTLFPSVSPKVTSYLQKKR